MWLPQLKETTLYGLGWNKSPVSLVTLFFCFNFFLQSKVFVYSGPACGTD